MNMEIWRLFLPQRKKDHYLCIKCIEHKHMIPDWVMHAVGVHTMNTTMWLVWCRQLANHYVFSYEQANLVGNMGGNSAKISETVIHAQVIHWYFTWITMVNWFYFFFWIRLIEIDLNYLLWRWKNNDGFKKKIENKNVNGVWQSCYSLNYFCLSFM